MLKMKNYNELVELLDGKKTRHFANVEDLTIQQAIVNTYNSLTFLEKGYKIKRINFKKMLTILDGIAIPLKNK
jgi:hypothetical protein